MAALALFVLAAASYAAAAAAYRPPPPLGRWLSQDRDGVFDIEPCGAALCGHLIGMRYTGAMPTDDHGEAQCGLLMLTGFRQSADDPSRWTGEILDPHTGRRYHAEIWSPRPGVLKLRGYLLLPLFGETQRWTRYDGEIGPDCHLPN